MDVLHLRYPSKSCPQLQTLLSFLLPPLFKVVIRSLQHSIVNLHLYSPLPAIILVATVDL